MELLAALLAVGALLLVAVTVVGLYLSRHTALSGRVGSFACAVAPDSEPDAPGATGIAQYGSGRLLWWRVFSLAPRPARTWSREELVIVERVPTDAVDDRGRRLVRLRCRHGDDAFQLVVSAPAGAGLVSWLESGPGPTGKVV